MKYKTTQREVKSGYSHVIYTGYCNLQTLLHFENPNAYTTRAEGWGADVYSFGSVAIVTGYAPFGTIRADYATCKAYEAKAAKIANHATWKWETKKLKTAELIRAFIQEVTQ